MMRNNSVRPDIDKKYRVHIIVEVTSSKSILNNQPICNWHGEAVR